MAAHRYARRATRMTGCLGRLASWVRCSSPVLTILDEIACLPPTVRYILRLLTLFRIEGTSCLLPPNVAPFWVYAFTVIGLTTFMLGTTWLLLNAADRCGCHRLRNQLEVRAEKTTFRTF